jgi:hypothetical protein
MSFMVWLFVRIHMMNQNACLASCEDVLAALPTRATRDPLNGNHIALFNPERLAARSRCGAISHLRNWSCGHRRTDFVRTP